VFYAPAWRLWESRNDGDDEQREQYLECNGEAPGDGRGLKERETQVYPVAYHYAKDDQSALGLSADRSTFKRSLTGPTFDHDHLSASMGL